MQRAPSFTYSFCRFLDKDRYPDRGATLQRMLLPQPSNVLHVPEVPRRESIKRDRHGSHNVDHQTWRGWPVMIMLLQITCTQTFTSKSGRAARRRRRQCSHSRKETAEIASGREHTDVEAQPATKAGAKTAGSSRALPPLAAPPPVAVGAAESVRQSA